MRNGAQVIDLHCHSTVSDGTLSPAQVVCRAHQRGVDVLALTDHDDIAGLGEARAEADRLGMLLINGVEVSVSWGAHTIHVVGLGIDDGPGLLFSGLHAVRAGRTERAHRIADALDACGIHDALEGASAYVSNPELISRTHFARFLVERGHARDVRDVFQNYLVEGRPGYVPHVWPSLAQAVGWIRNGGGIAVVAHPGRYRMSGTEMTTLLGEFRDMGGAGLEVVSGSQDNRQMRKYARLALQFGLRASCGSDFHSPDEGDAELGGILLMPTTVEPVWKDML